MKTIKKCIIIALGIITLISVFDINTVADTCAENIIRLHVIANSNTEYDQQTKYNVRDAILAQYSNILASAQTKEEAEEIIQNNIDAIISTAYTVAGENMDITAEYTNTYIPERTYGDTTYPAGNYDALRIIIGEGEGENWWCVMFPPLCLEENSNTDKNDDIIADKAPKIKIRLKIVDFIMRIFKI